MLSSNGLRNNRVPSVQLYLLAVLTAMTLGLYGFAIRTTCVLVWNAHWYAQLTYHQSDKTFVVAPPNSHTIMSRER